MDPLQGRPRVGITYGPTRAWIDPVRYIANASTGKLGASLADRFASVGARVEAIVGPHAARPRSSGVALHPIESPAQLQERLELFSNTHLADPFRLWIHAMAVLDFVPEATSKEKIPSDEKGLQLKLVPTPKIIDSFQTLFPDCSLVGFKLLSGADLGKLKEAAEELGQRARCDLVVANFEPFRDPAGHEAHFWDRKKNDWFGPRKGKPEIAEEILRWFAAILRDDVPAQA